MMRSLLPWILIVSLWTLQWVNGELDRRKARHEAGPAPAHQQTANPADSEMIVLRDGIDRPVRIRRVLIPSVHGSTPLYEVVVCRRPRPNSCRAEDETLWFPLAQWEEEVNGPGKASAKIRSPRH